MLQAPCLEKDHQDFLAGWNQLQDCQQVIAPDLQPCLPS